MEVVVFSLGCVIFGALSFYLGYRIGVQADQDVRHYSALSVFESLADLSEKQYVDITIEDREYRLVRKQ